MKTVGVIGGMGPEATVYLLSKLIADTPASCDQDHIRALIDHNPAVPNRHEAISGVQSSIAPLLVEMARNLERGGADFLVMVCNTAHAYANEIRAAIDIPFLSIIDITVAALQVRGDAKVGVLAADGCIQAGLYQSRLEAAGRQAVMLAPERQLEFMGLIYRIKAGSRAPEIGESLARLAESLVKDGAESVIAGCTEIPLVLDSRQVTVPVLSSTDLLVARIIEFARA